MHERGGHTGSDRLFQGLNLTKDQHDQIKAIRERYKPQADSMRTGGAMRDSTSRAAYHSLMMQQMREIRGVLTPDQQKQFDDNVAKMRDRRQEHGNRGDHSRGDDHDGPPPDNSGGNPPPPAA